jgi:hypothetical protein
MRLAPGQVAVGEPMLAWYPDAGQAPRLSQGAKRRSAAPRPTPRGATRGHVAAVRGLRRAPPSTGGASRGRPRPALARQRPSAWPPVGPGPRQPPAPVEAWRAVPGPAMIRAAPLAAAPPRLHRTGHMARRPQTTAASGRRGRVSGGPWRRTGSGRPWPPGAHDSCGRGRTVAFRRACGARGTARSAPAPVWDALVWPARCRVRRAPALRTPARARAQLGAGWPQALHARRHTRRAVWAPLARHHARRLAVYLAAGSEREACARRRKEVAQSQPGVTPPRRQRDTQAPPHGHGAALRPGLAACGQRRQPTVAPWTCAPRRPRVAWLSARGIVNEPPVASRSVGPTGPTGDTPPLCHGR